MKDRKKEIKTSYSILGSGFSGIYDSMVTYSSLPGRVMNRMIWGFNKDTNAEWIREALSPVPSGFHGSLLEVPVGTGVITMPLYCRLPDARITCLDYSEDMMKNASERAETMGIRNISFVQGDAGNLPFEDEAFDIVLSLNGFHAFPDKEAAYQETYRVLKKGGIFCGCFYVEGQMKRTDFVCRHLFVPKGSFTPPFETALSLKRRLENMYGTVRFRTIHSEGIFCCRKEG
ncbi:MAG: methyltransferase domain-containing protein [Solobacterium sp.]|nr:methyltransferase domain-containing protein [Solobacterium sp.]